MQLKTYQRIKLGFVMVIAFIFSLSITLDNYLVPVTVLIVSSLALLYMRRKVTEIIADERDYATGGRAALLSMQIYSWIGVAAMLLLYANRALNPAYEPIAMTLAYSITFLMLLYATIFHYYNRFTFSDKKMLFTIAVLTFLLVMAIFGLRLFSGEDNWICADGQWVEHGHPSFPAPETPCR